MLHLLPPPKSLRMDEGFFVISPDARIVMETPWMGPMRTAAEQLQQEINAACGLTLSMIGGEACKGDIHLRLAPDLEAKAYTLTIAPEGIAIAGRFVTDVLTGAQTLRQIIRQRGWKLPALTIEDAPAFETRGFYHDVTRGRIPSLDWLKQLADECCFYKLNQLQLYVEHTYLFRDLPELHQAAGTPLTAEEILELDDYCIRRGIDLVPSLSTFGHLFELLHTKRFSHLCELPDSDQMPSTMPNRMAHHTIDPTNPESVRLILAMIDEYMALFRSPYFNICADETFDLGKGRNQGREERGLYMGFVRKLCEHVVSRGRTPMFWGDIVVKFADAVKELPEGTICLNWGYAADVREDSTRILAAAGARQYVCPGVSGWNQWMPRIRTSYHNIRRMAEYGAKYGAIGLLNTDWGDYGHINDPRFSLPGMVMGACAAWNGTLPEMDAMLAAISRFTYGDDSGRTASILADLADAPVYSWWHVVRYKDKAQGMLSDPWGEPQQNPVEDARFLAGQERVLTAEAALRDCSLHLAPAIRPMTARWLNAAEAIRLWDAAYHTVLKGERSTETAQALLRWLHRYEAQWREVSKESELWRIRDVTAWYADRLM